MFFCFSIFFAVLFAFLLCLYLFCTSCTTLIVIIGSRTWAFQRTHYWTHKIQDGGDPPSWRSTWRHFFCRGDPISIKFRRLVQNDMSTAVIWSQSKPEVEFQYGARLREFNGMSSQSHLPHCRVLSPSEINVMIPEIRAALHGKRILSAILKIVFRHILFLFSVLMQLGLWRAVAFVSSPRYTC